MIYCKDLAFRQYDATVPVQLKFKLNLSKISAVYHFLQRETDRLFNDILVKNHILKTVLNVDIVSHLFVTESFYFKPLASQEAADSYDYHMKTF